MRMTTKQAVLVAVIALLSLTGRTYAQDLAPATARTQTKAPDKPLVALKVQVTLSRYEGGKKTSNLPFTLWVNANDSNQTVLNVGSQVAMPQSDKTFQYRSVGTSLVCSANQLEDGRLRVYLTVNDSSIAPAKDTSGYPSFQSFTTSNYLLLRDGQTAQFVAATDKITGEVTSVDVTVTVLK